MAISKAKKEAIIAELERKFKDSQSFIMADYRGLKMEELRTLRNRLRAESCAFHVVKNRLVRLALERAGLPWDDSLFQGPTAIGFCYEDVVAPAKILVQYAKENKILTLRGGILAKQVVSVSELEAMAALPPQRVLLGQVIAQMQAPTSALMGALVAPVRDLFYLFQARSKQLEAQG